MTGLLMPFSGKATIDGINKLCCGDLQRKQSATNRCLTENAWAEEARGERRIARLQQHPLLRPGAKGGISMDDGLLETTGPPREGVDHLFDPSQKQDILGHCLVSGSDNTLGQSDPLFFAPSCTEAVCQSEQGLALELVCRTKIQRAIASVAKGQAEQLAGVFACDRWSRGQDLVAASETRARLWVSKAANETSGIWTGQRLQLQQMTERLPTSASHKSIPHGPGSDCALKVMPVWSREGRQAVLVCWNDDLGQAPPFSLITHALWWDTKRLLPPSFQRWPIEEIPREGQQHEG